MADYIATARTNYFRVTDEQKYQKLFKGLVSDNQLFDFTKEENGIVFHAFGSYGWISYETGQDDGESNDGFDFFLEELQQILPDDEAFVYQEIGHEKLRYVTGGAVVVTSKVIKQLGLDTLVKDTIETLLGSGNTVSGCSY